MHKDLPDIVINQFDLLNRSERAEAKLIHLKSIIEKLKQDSKTHFIMDNLDLKLHEKNLISQKNIGMGVEWIRKNFFKLQNSKWKNHPKVKQNLEIVKTIILCKPIPSRFQGDNNKFNDEFFKLIGSITYPQIGVTGTFLTSLFAIAQIIAEFGELEIFKDWAYFDQGHFSKLILPRYLEDILSDFLPEKLSSWEISRDVEPIVLYQYLKTLSEYESHTKLPNDFPIYSWEEHEARCYQIGLYEFFKIWLQPDQVVSSCQKINNLVGIFLSMINVKIIEYKNRKKRKSPLKIEVKHFIEQEIKNELTKYNLPVDVNKLKSNDEMYSYLINLAQSTNSKFASEIRASVVQNIYNKVLMEKNIQRKGGAPRKKNSLK